MLLNDVTDSWLSVSLVEYGYLLTIDWQVACEEAEARNTAG